MLIRSFLRLAISLATIGFLTSATLSASTRDATALPLCSGSRTSTCIVDGDTGRERGMRWRLTSRSGGVDAPEIGQAECADERRAGNAATVRLRQLMAGGYRIEFGPSTRRRRASWRRWTG